MDSDRPERWSPFDIPAWFLGLWPALKDRLHSWLHKDRPKCPDCAEWQTKADAQAEKCRAEEAAHAETASQLRAARVIAQHEKARADEAERKLGERGEVDPELPPLLTYARVVAMQEPKGEAVIDPETMRDIRDRAEEGRTWWPDGRPVNALCHRRDGLPAITTAEIMARVREA